MKQHELPATLRFILYYFLINKFMILLSITTKSSQKKF